jgi:mRNA-degrading endonuclease RelE of RelBE toxin-antitoxin system
VARVVLARRARSELLELNWPLIDAIQDALGLLERDPLVGHPLRGRLRGLRSLRVGTFRIIHQLAEDQFVSWRLDIAPLRMAAIPDKSGGLERPSSHEQQLCTAS